MANEFDEDYEDEGYGSPSPYGGPGGLAVLQLGNQYTTPEALKYSRKILDQSTSGGEDQEQMDYLSKVKSNAEIARQALRSAREKLAAKQYGNQEAWLAAAAGFGSPTRTGSFGESVGNVAGNLIEPMRRKRELESNRDRALLDIDMGLAGVDDNLLNAQLELLKLKQQHQSKMSVEALKTMGRRVSEDQKTPQMARRAVDREYAKDYVAFGPGGGAADSAKALEELEGARDQLRGYSIDPKTGQKVAVRGGKDDNLTGPIVGTLSNLPWIGKTTQDVFFPKSADVQETVEYTVQRSLRPILGSQFTKEEGERLIARVYNPRLGEEINAARLDRLIKQIRRANEAKIAAAQYFEQHGTLGPNAQDPQGFRGMVQWSVGDFMPEDSPTPVNPAESEGGPLNQGLGVGEDEVIPYEALIPAGEDDDQDYAEGGQVYAEGGEVTDESAERVRHKMPDGRVVEANPGVPYERILQRYSAATGQSFEEEESEEEIPDQPAPGMDFDAATSVELGGSALGHGILGAAGGRYGTKLLQGMSDLIPGHRASSAENRVMAGLENEGLTPAEWTRLVSQAQKMGVPATGLDLGGIELRALGEASMNPENPETRELYTQLKERQAGARTRIGDRINQSLKPDDYFSQMKKLKKDLQSNSKPLYTDLYKRFPALKSESLMQLFETPTGKKAVKKAVAAIRDRPGATLGKADATGMITKPSLEFLDQVKDELDDMITKEETKGGVYKATKRGKRWRELRNALRGEVDTLTTDPKTGESAYKTARAQYSGDLEMIDALRFGREEFLKMAPGEIQDTIKDMNFSERDALRTGVSQALFEKIGKVGHRVSPAEKVIDTPEMDEKLKLIFDKPSEYKIFKEAMDLESRIFEESQSTIRKGRSKLMTTRDPRDNVFRRTVKKAPTLGIFSPTQWAIRWLRRTEPVKKKEAAEIIRILRTSDPKDLKKLEAKLTPKFGREAARKKRVGKATMIGAGLGAIFPFAKDYFEEDEEEPIQKARGGLVRRKPSWQSSVDQVLNTTMYGGDDIVSPMIEKLGR